jgi:hypothetical protein
VTFLAPDADLGLDQRGGWLAWRVCKRRHQLLFWRKRARRGVKQMTFKLSNRSLEKLEGVDDRLVAVVKHAIGISKIDFGVICGMRTIQEQEAACRKEALVRQ